MPKMDMMPTINTGFKMPKFNLGLSKSEMGLIKLPKLDLGFPKARKKRKKKAKKRKK